MIQKNSVFRFAWLLRTLRRFAEEFAVEVCLPTVVAGDARDSWPIDFYGHVAHLTRSNALHLGTVSSSVGSCFCLQRVFRKEPVASRYHLSEFSLFECALTGVDGRECMDCVENMIRKIHCEAFKAFGDDEVAEIGEMPFEQVDWLDASHKIQDVDKVDFNRSPGADVQIDMSHGNMEKSFPFFLVNLPRGQVSWACKDTQDGRKVSFNLIAPYAGEISEGGERETNREFLIEKFARANRVPQLSWYAYAMGKVDPPLSIFAIGVERLAMWLFKHEDIDEVNMFPRKLGFSEIEQGLSHFGKSLSPVQVTDRQ